VRPEAVDAVLAKLRIERPEPTLAGLRTLYAAWCRRVPFDNVLKLIHISESAPGPLPGSTSESFFQDWLACGAGGTCWAGNGALHDLLAAVGFRAQRAIATMFPEAQTAPNHGSVVVSFDRERWIADASMLTDGPIRLRTPGEPGETGDLPRFEWVDDRPAVIWRTLRAPEGFPCRFERIGADAAEWDAFHRRSGAWSPFNYELSIRTRRGPRVVGVSCLERYEFEGSGPITVTELDRPGRTRFLVEELGITPEVARRVPDDRPVPPRPAGH
jgi:N-hydroxyarylamine O-acetyltransferase